MEKKLFLLCNDDGIHAPGIRTLAEALHDLAEIYIVAPDMEKSASSHAISINIPIRIEAFPGTKDCQHLYAVNGTPADCVMVALRKILPRKPDWILSGINRGGNLGHDTLYSGTVGAAMEGAINGIRSMAISSHGLYGDNFHYETAAQIVRKILLDESKIPLEPGKIFNINVPTMPLSSIRGVVAATLGRRVYENDIVESRDPGGKPYYWLGGAGKNFKDIPGSDCNLVDEGYATISILAPSLLDAEATKKASDALKSLMLS